MKSLCIVLPLPTRYFDDMIEACMQLHDFYQKETVYPLYVATMKRAYYFENARGESCEVERGDRFLIFYGEPEYFNANDLFDSSFPSPDILREVEWEGIDFQMEIVMIDDLLEQTLADLRIGMNTYSENQWMILEDYARSGSVSCCHEKDSI